MKSIKLLAKPFRDQSKPYQTLRKSIETLANPSDIHWKSMKCLTKSCKNPLEINSIPYQMLQIFFWIFCQIIQKSCGNQSNSSPSPLELNQNLFQIFRRYIHFTERLFRNQLNSLPNPLKIHWKSIKLLTKCFRIFSNIICIANQTFSDSFETHLEIH